ncbi:twin-arginine translocation signal domain-containing protein [Alkalilimnicola ehrlichii]|uniref:twin-arginine translocation signal domain-containing protein n=1 Tax=Alkalilimnicola ehrlichii TaxID=351052 RepID=UPI00216266DB
MTDKKQPADWEAEQTAAESSSSQGLSRRTFLGGAAVAGVAGAALPAAFSPAVHRPVALAGLWRRITTSRLASWTPTMASGAAANPARCGCSVSPPCAN